MGCHLPKSLTISVVRGKITFVLRLSAKLTTLLFFPYYFRNPSISHISQWYIGLWSSQLIEGTPHVYTALQCCRSLQDVFGAVEHSKAAHWDALQKLCNEVYEYLALRANSDTLLPVERAHISSALNDLAQSHDVSEDSYNPFSNDGLHGKACLLS